LRIVACRLARFNWGQSARIAQSSLLGNAPVAGHD
jgi:hypothetical protein